MTITQYETRFVELAYHTLLLLPTEKERVRMFIDILAQPIRLQMAKESGSEISFQATANVTRRVEMVLAQGVLQASHSTSGSRGPYVPHSGQPVYNAPSSPISTPSIQSYCRGHPAHSGQPQFPPPQHQDGCFECGSYGHIRRTCPRLLGVTPQHQGSRAMVLALVVAPLAQPARGRGQAARGRSHTVRRGGQAVRGGVQPARGRPRDVVQSDGSRP
ncbi:uncharacterized protein [Nicotiana tomentosiformis]|uniref:uncharacterized protein n=1 Tax=Nicotiana tomentosiformis TaxID=4098 RepID=UPI00388CD5D9